MRKVSIVILMFLLAIPLLGVELDEALRTIFTYCSVIDHEGDSVLMTNDGFNEESDAYSWVANCAHVVLAIREDWVDCPSTYASRISSLDAIGAIWATEYQTFVVTIPVWEIIENFGDESYLDMESEEFIGEIQDYIEYHGDVSPLSMY